MCLFAVPLIRHYKRREKENKRRVLGRMPTDVPSPNPEKYELKDIKSSQEDVTYVEEIGLWNKAVLE